MTISKAGAVWVNIDEYDGGQHRLRKVQRHGVLARGVLYYCAPEDGKPLCAEQSDWHWLLGRGGKPSAAAVRAPSAGMGPVTRLLGRRQPLPRHCGGAHCGCARSVWGCHFRHIYAASCGRRERF